MMADERIAMTVRGRLKFCNHQARFTHFAVDFALRSQESEWDDGAESDIGDIVMGKGENEKGDFFIQN